MILRLFVPNYTDTENPAVREKCGALAGAVGLALNLLLFAGKLAAGLITGAISVTADAFNNLSDAASSVVTLVGFRLAGQKADADHPFGHGRIEYLAGLIVSLLILLVGVELGRSSIEKILRPENTTLTVLTGGILIASILIKLWMACFYRRLGGLIQSAALQAAAADARSDVLATSVVLLGLVIARLTSLRLDGWLGLLVAALILKAGFDSARSTLNPLLGQAPDTETVRDIEELILSHPLVLGIHDLIIHDYGPGRRLMSVHAEVPADIGLMKVHEVIDHIERELAQRFHIDAVIHMDPIQLGDPEVDRLRELTSRLAQSIDPALTVHDFQVTRDGGHTVLSFDVVAPYDVPLTDDEVRAALEEKLLSNEPACRCMINIDRSYVL